MLGQTGSITYETEEERPLNEQLEYHEHCVSLGRSAGVCTQPPGRYFGGISRSIAARSRLCTSRVCSRLS